MRPAITSSGESSPVDPSLPPSGGEGQAGVRWVEAVAVAAVAVGVVLRFWTRSDLWLDEALTVNIADQGVTDIVDSLRRDGHPPLHYVLLHGWMQLFGAGDAAVRSLSGVLSVLSLPVAWVLGGWLGGRAVAVPMIAVLAASPFAVRYATEARMYALVTLLVLIGWLLLLRALAVPTWSRLAPVTIVGALLLLTHYWAFYLLAAVGALLLWKGWRAVGDDRRRWWRAAIAMALSGVLFLPWLGAFLFQAQHTGTPWGRPERPAQVLMTTLEEMGGGVYGEARLLGLLLAVLLLLGAFGRVVDRHRIELDLRGRDEARAALVVVLGTLGFGVVAGFATGSTYAARYGSVVLPMVVVLVAFGVSRFADRRLAAGVLAVVVGLGFVGMARNVVVNRTQGGDIGRVLAADAGPDDVVGVCPDQLGPSTRRYAGATPTMLTYPEGGSPRFVDWSDYEERMDAGDPAAFADALIRRAGDHDVWMVFSPGYRTLDTACEQVVASLQAVRSSSPVIASDDAFEHAWLLRFPPS